jgi:hypothetical protein
LVASNIADKDIEGLLAKIIEASGIRKQGIHDIKCNEKVYLEPL